MSFTVCKNACTQYKNDIFCRNTLKEKDIKTVYTKHREILTFLPDSSIALPLVSSQQSCLVSAEKEHSGHRPRAI